MANVKRILDNLRNDVESTEHDYAVECLKAAVDYCKQQYCDSCGEVDPLPSIKGVGLHNEDDKYVLLEMFLQTL